MTYAVVTTNLLDMWSEPRYGSERVNQALFGEILRITKRKHDFLNVRQCDGYRGWVDHRHVRNITKSAYQRYLKAPKSLVIGRTAKLYDAETGRTSPSPHFLYYGTRVVVTARYRGLVRIRMADGGVYSLKAGGVSSLNRNIETGIDGAALVEEAKRFLGVPYLWGGLTPAGFDCSGLVRSVLARFGVEIPRDTKDQVKSGERVNRREVRSGDLLFFERHVGFAVGKNRLIHSSLAGGGVRINSLRRELPDYREDLDRSFDQARRLI
jgi:cell wall-associated NlpC family hydrolase